MIEVAGDGLARVLHDVGAGVGSWIVFGPVFESVRTARVPRIQSHRRPVISDDRAGEQQEPDRGGSLPLLGVIEHEAEAPQFVCRQEALAGLRPVAPHVAAGVGALRAKIPELGLPHHDGKYRQGPAGVAWRAVQGIEPVAHIGAVDLGDAHRPEEGQEVAVDPVSFALSR